MKLDLSGVAFCIAIAIIFSSFASCQKAVDVEKEKTIQLKLQLEHNAKTK